MPTITDEQLSPLIRRVNPSQFSAEAHGPGHHLVFDQRNNTVAQKRKSWLHGLVAGNALTEYYVRHINKPLVIENIPFVWKEGTSNVSLELMATFQMRTNKKDLDESLALTKALHGPQGVGGGLYELIEGVIDTVLKKQYARYQAKNQDLLKLFYRGTVLHHNSIELDTEVSEKVGEQLGIHEFRIGLRLEDLPPQHFPVEKLTTLNIRDYDKKSYHIKTNAELELANYQQFKRLQREEEHEIRKEIEADIDRVVTKHVWNYGFFDLIESFYSWPANRGEPSISERIEEDIKSLAAAKGFEIKLFHTLCDIAPLQLIDQGMRFELKEDTHTFLTANSTDPVGLNLTVNLGVDSFQKMKSLIKPEFDIDQIRSEITKQLYAICQDVLNNCSMYDYDLAFESQVRPKLESQLLKVLEEKFGFNVEIVTLQSIPSENKERYDALVNDTRPIEFEFSSQADAGTRDYVHYRGTFAVSDMAPHGYTRFVTKDFGFCRNSSKRSESAYLALVEALNEKTDKRWTINSDGFEKEWKRYTIDLELQAIAKSIKENTEEYFSKQSKIDALTRLAKNSAQVRVQTEDIGNMVISNEFGLTIQIYEFKRLNTVTELDQQQLLETESKTRLRYGEHDQNLLEQELDADLEYRKRQSELRKEQLNLRAEDEDLELDEDEARHHAGFESRKAARMSGMRNIDEHDIPSAAGQASENLLEEPQWRLYQNQKTSAQPGLQDHRSENHRLEKKLTQDAERNGSDNEADAPAKYSETTD